MVLNAKPRLWSQAWALTTLFALLGVLPVLAGDDNCQRWQQRREELSRQAMQAEIEAVHRLRLQICADEERQESLRNAERFPQAESAPFDYEAYIRCREQAEAAMLRSQRMRNRSQRHFTVYTAWGAKQAQQVDDLLLHLERNCQARP
ncbi:MAG: hypothetical protein VKJ05_07585 [Synechococcaceae cyanobacterium]|nr:hypothetical protein [Synechococcaceae cyanobacterium]